MAAADIFSKLAGIFGRRKTEDTDDQLLQLYWNRVELKKDFAGLREERYQLQEQVKESEAQTRRMEAQLEALEDLLVSPEGGYNAIVYYQYRALWRACNAQLTKFCLELRKQQEDRERKKQIMQFNQERQEKLNQLNQKIEEVKTEAGGIKVNMTTIEAEIKSRKGFWNYLKRRDLQQQLLAYTASFEEIRDALEKFFQARLQIEGQPWPEFPGLATDGRRLINIAVIALAQHLYVYFARDGLALRARESMQRQPQDVKYGVEKNCLHLMEKIKHSLVGMQSALDQTQEIRARTAQLNDKVKYRSDDETVPMADSVGPTSAVKAGLSLPRGADDVNVLQEDIWGVVDVFLTK